MSSLQRVQYLKELGEGAARRRTTTATYTSNVDVNVFIKNVLQKSNVVAANNFKFCLRYVPHNSAVWMALFSVLLAVTDDMSFHNWNKRNTPICLTYLAKIHKPPPPPIGALKVPWRKGTIRSRMRYLELKVPWKVPFNFYSRYLTRYLGLKVPYSGAYCTFSPRYLKGTLYRCVLNSRVKQKNVPSST